jgi:hypothetical protein
LSRPAGTMVLLFSVSCCSWDDRYMPHWPAVGWSGVSRIFCWYWPWTVILLLSASQVARITGVSYHCPTRPPTF